MNYSHLQRGANRKKALTRAAHFLGAIFALSALTMAGLIDRSKPTVLKHLRTNGVEKTALGYWTDDIIRCFRLQGSIKRWKAEE